MKQECLKTINDFFDKKGKSLRKVWIVAETEDDDGQRFLHRYGINTTAVDILGYCQLASLVVAQDMGVIMREEVDQIRMKSVKEAPDA